MPSNTGKYFSYIYCGAEFYCCKTRQYTYKNQIKIELLETILNYYINAMSVERIIKYIGLNNKDLNNF